MATMSLRDLCSLDLETVSQWVASDLLPDVRAALDVLMPRVMEGDRNAVRRYVAYVEEAAMVLCALGTEGDDGFAVPEIAGALMRRDIVEIATVAPTEDGAGVLLVMVDRLRGLAIGRPQEVVRIRSNTDAAWFERFVKLIDEITVERSNTSPLRRLMMVLDLSSSDVARLMGVQRQAVDKWLLSSLPRDRVAKIGTIASVANILNHRLRSGLAPAVARREAEAFGGRSMLDMIRDDDHDELYAAVRASFDFASVA